MAISKNPRVTVEQLHSAFSNLQHAQMRFDEAREDLSKAQEHFDKLVRICSGRVAKEFVKTAEFNSF